jgi:glycosyltransferase involved in cell wall biosynthesis
MSLPLVSIIIPVYNGANYLAEAIDSALSQTYEHVEVLVLNDGSTDGGATESVALRYGDKIRYYSKSNGGVATALNLGIEKMTGEYFSWLSHDDIYYPNKIQDQVGKILTHDRDTILFSNVKIIDPKGNFVINHNVKAFKYEYQLLNLLCNQEINGCSLLIPKKMFRDAGNFDVNLKTTQDYDMWIRLSAIGKFVYQDIYTVGSRRHSGQESWSDHHIEGVDQFFSEAINKIDVAKVNEMNPKIVDEFVLSMTKNFSQKRKNSKILKATSAFIDLAIEDKLRLTNIKLNFRCIKTRESLLKKLKNLIPISLKLVLKKRLGAQ